MRTHESKLGQACCSCSQSTQSGVSVMSLLFININGRRSLARMQSVHFLPMVSSFKKRHIKREKKREEALLSGGRERRKNVEPVFMRGRNLIGELFFGQRVTELMDSVKYNGQTKEIRLNFTEPLVFWVAMFDCRLLLLRQIWILVQNIQSAAYLNFLQIKPKITSQFVKLCARMK